MKKGCSLTSFLPPFPPTLPPSHRPQGLGTKPIQKYVERLLQAGSNCGIIVYRNNITAIAKKLLQAGAIPGVKLEVFKVRKKEIILCV